VDSFSNSSRDSSIFHIEINVLSSGDIDLIIYDSEAAVSMVEIFRKTTIPYSTVVRRTGTIIVDSGLDLSWRRGYYNGVHISWTGVPVTVAGHCDIVYWNLLPPQNYKYIEVYIEPMQETALLYPPCVYSSEGYYIISYEYNIGYLLYQGGMFAITSYITDNIIYLGVKGKMQHIGRLLS